LSKGLKAVSVYFGCGGEEKEPWWSRTLRKIKALKSRDCRIDEQLLHAHLLSDESLLERVLHQGLDVFAVEFAEKPCVRPSLSTQWLATSRL
jgi:hypothetical protein